MLGREEGCKAHMATTSVSQNSLIRINAEKCPNF